MRQHARPPARPLPQDSTIYLDRLVNLPVLLSTLIKKILTTPWKNFVNVVETLRVLRYLISEIKI